MISKKALLELLENWRDRLGITPPEEAAKIIIKAVIDKVKNFPEEDATDTNVGSKWIPVSERLPEGCKEAELEVLVLTHESYPDAFFNESGFALYYPGTKTFHSVYGNRVDITNIVKAWMHKP